MSLERVLLALDYCDLTYLECLTILLTSPGFIVQPCNVSDILHKLVSSQATKTETTKWALSIAQETYQSQMAVLSHKDSGFHFIAKMMIEEHLRNFSIDTIATEMQKNAPDLWELLGVLLSADPERSYKKEWARRRTEHTGTSWKCEKQEFAEVELGDLGDDRWEDVDADRDELPLVDEGEDEPEDIQEQKEEQFNALLSIVTISCICACNSTEGRN